MTPHEVKLTEIQGLKAKGLGFPRSLYDARLRAADAAKRVKDLEGEIKDAEREELLAASVKTVNASTDAKPLYTNDTQRKAAAARALAESPTHRDRLKRLADAESESLNARLLCTQIEDEHRAYQEIVKLVVAEVDLLTAWVK